MLLIKRAALPRPHEGALELLAEQFVPPWLDCGTSRRIRETEAEATAFVVCHAIGLETGSAASDYIQLWNGDAQLLTESLAYIRQAASQMHAAHTMDVF
jgi:DNA transposition AAA+ family ATPase